MGGGGGFFADAPYDAFLCADACRSIGFCSDDQSFLACCSRKSYCRDCSSGAVHRRGHAAVDGQAKGEGI